MADNGWGWFDDIKSFLRWQALQPIWDWLWGTVLGKAVVAAVTSVIGIAIGYFKSPSLYHAAIGVLAASLFILGPSAFTAIRNKRPKDEPTQHESPLVFRNGNLAWRSTERLKQIANHHFINDTVLLDGVEYLNCVFEHCTLVYEGSAPIGLADCQVIRHEGQINLTLRSANPIVNAAFSIYIGLQGIPPVRPIGWRFEPHN